METLFDPSDPKFWILVTLALSLAALLIGANLPDSHEEKGKENKPKKKIIYTAMQLEQIRILVAAAGYAYDWEQDIFYTPHDVWQKKFGYCRLYDETAPSLNMVFDSEPIQFEYDGKRWLIELWKGQYGITAGCEIGVYYTAEPDVNIPGVFSGPFYYGVNAEEYLMMFCSLKKNKRQLFSKNGRHWWLTGFVLGEYTEPEELSMIALLTLKDKQMSAAFLKALQKLGYRDDEYEVQGNTVAVNFTLPYSQQPASRYSETSIRAQQINKFNCQLYQSLTNNMENMLDMLTAVQGNAPQLYDTFLNAAKPNKDGKLMELLESEWGDRRC